MGMYTGLRGFVDVNDEYIDDIKKLVEDKCWRDCFSDDSIPGYDVIAEFKEDCRCDFIPYGVVCYMPEDWREHQPVELFYDRLSFTCSLKAYGATIERFLNMLPYIAKGWVLQELYEEDHIPTIHAGGIYSD